jgi:hypothetical protein
MANKALYTKAQLTGYNLQRLIDRSDSDEMLVTIIRSLKANDMHVPCLLADVAA